MIDLYPRVKSGGAPLYSLAVPHPATGADTEVFRGVLADAACVASAFARAGRAYGMAPVPDASPDPQATGRVPQLAIELAAIAHAIGELAGRYWAGCTNRDFESLKAAHVKLLALADKVQAEASDL